MSSYARNLWIPRHNRLGNKVSNGFLSPEAATGGEVFHKKDVPENFAKFIGKHLYQSLAFDIVASLQLYLKRDFGTGDFQRILQNF